MTRSRSRRWNERGVVYAFPQAGYLITVVRTHCYECGGVLEPRVEWAFNPLHPRWGAWCSLCCGWWPWVDDCGRPCCGENWPAPFRLTDDPFRITPTCGAERPSDAE